MRTHKAVRHRAGRLAVAAALAMVPTLCATPVLAASPAAGSPRPVGTYLLSVTAVDGSGPTRTAMLTCGPDGGTHGAAEAACDQLRAANGSIEAIPEQPGSCTLEYAPVRVAAHGYWKGDYRSYARTHGNRCVAVRATGGTIFNF